MADTTKPDDTKADLPVSSTGDIKAATQSMDKLSESFRNAKIDVDKYREHLEAAQKALGGGGAVLIDPRQGDLLDKAAESLKKAGVSGSIVDKAFASIAGMAGKAGTAIKESLDSAMFGALEQKLGVSKGAFAGLAEKAGQFGVEMAKSGAPLAMVELAKAAFDAGGKATALFNSYQENFLGIDKVIRQSRASFGGFGDDVGKNMRSAGENAGQFAQDVSGTSQLTRRDFKDITSATKELSDVMGLDLASTSAGLEKQGGALGKLASEYSDFGKGLTPVAAALLLSNATGMDSKTITGMMGRAYQDLGEDVAGAVESFGKIKDVAKGSGLSMSVVSDTIFKGAEGLKMWGGTVNAVTPIFDMFSRSLEQGRKGLAPELFEKFTAGINSMSFAQRAFIGIQGGRGKGSGGALGAGLEMEEALEDKTGKGMKKYVDNITKTLEQFGGGKIITRQEAIKDPALQSQFMVQRGMLEKMGMSSDPAVQNKILKALQDTSKHGMQTSADGSSALKDLLQQGQKQGDEDTTARDRLSQMEQQAITTSGHNIVDAITKTIGSDLIGNMGKIVSHLEKQIRKGKTTGEDVVEMGEDVEAALTGKKSKKAGAPKPKLLGETIVEAQEALKKEKMGQAVQSMGAQDKGGGTEKDIRVDYEKSITEARKSLKDALENFGKAGNAPKDAGASLSAAIKAANAVMKMDERGRGREDVRTTMAAQPMNNRSVPSAPAADLSRNAQTPAAKGATAQPTQHPQQIPVEVLLKVKVDGDHFKGEVSKVIGVKVRQSDNSGGL